MREVRCPITRTLAIINGVVFGYSLILVSFLIARGDWGSIYSVLWIQSEHSFLSVEYILFSVIAIVASLGAILAMKKHPIGYILFGTSLFMIIASAKYLAKEQFSAEERFNALCVFILPGIFFILQARKEAK